MVARGLEVVRQLEPYARRDDPFTSPPKFPVEGTFISRIDGTRWYLEVRTRMSPFWVPPPRSQGFPPMVFAFSVVHD